MFEDCEDDETRPLKTTHEPPKTTNKLPKTTHMPTIIEDRYKKTKKQKKATQADPSAPTTTVTNKKKKQKKKVIPPEQREVLAYALSPLTELIDENTVEYVFEMLMEDPCDEEDTKGFARGILMEAVLSQLDMDEAVAYDVICDIFASFDAFVDALDTTHDPIVSPPTNTRIQPTPNTNTNTNMNTKIRSTTTNKTHTPPKDRQVPPVIGNNKTNRKKKKKQKQTTPPKTKTTHEIKRPIVTVEEVN